MIICYKKIVYCPNFYIFWINLQLYQSILCIWKELSMINSKKKKKNIRKLRLVKTYITGNQWSSYHNSWLHQQIRCMFLDFVVNVACYYILQSSSVFLGVHNFFIFVSNYFSGCLCKMIVYLSFIYLSASFSCIISSLILFQVSLFIYYQT